MKRVLITGCSTGIGEATALRLAAAGYPVIASVRRAEDGARLAGAAGPALTPVLLDVTDDASVRRAAAAVLADGGPPDVLVNNVGAPCLGAMEELAIADLRTVLEVNVIGALRVFQAFAPAMRARGSGHVINLSSSIGAAALPMYGGYCASKFALEAMSEAMRHELAPFGVTVNVLRPGIVTTPFAVKKRAQAPERVPPGSPYAGRVDVPSPPDLMAVVSTPLQVAAALQDLIEQPGPPFRRIVGQDSRRWLDARARLDDEAFFARLEREGYASR